MTPICSLTSRVAPALLAVGTLGLGASCGDLEAGDDGSAPMGLIASIETPPQVMIDDEQGTDVRVTIRLHHHGGPAVETLELVDAGLLLDLAPFADLALAIPADHPAFQGLAAGEERALHLRGRASQTHDDWGLCAHADRVAQDELRVGLRLGLRWTPGATGPQGREDFEALAVELGCSHTG